VSHRSLGFQSWILPAYFLTNTLQCTRMCFFTQRATHHDHSILFGFINITSGKQCKSRKSVMQFSILFWLCCPHLRPNIVLGALLPNPVTVSLSQYRHTNTHLISTNCTCVISGSRRNVNEICALLGYYAAYSGSSVPTFRYNLSVPSPRVKKSKHLIFM
jgi:hypothetical protein